MIGSFELSQDLRRSWADEATNPQVAQGSPYLQLHDAENCASLACGTSPHGCVSRVPDAGSHAVPGIGAEPFGSWVQGDGESGVGTHVCGLSM